MYSYLARHNVGCVLHPEMTLLALQDDVTVQDLADCDRAADMKGWLQRVHAWLFERDLFAGISSDTTLMRIHATAEAYESAAEDCFAPFQARMHSHVLCTQVVDALMILSLAFSIGSQLL